MILLPVLERELRATARHGFTYYLRVLGAGAALVASVWFGLENGFGSNLGRILFGFLHVAIFFAIWILAPVLAADCVSRERREGTLGLLFLTRLKGNDIVLAKGMAHGLRALTVWLAVLPIVTLPFLMGGASGREAALSVVLNFSAICWALAAGLLASATSQNWLRAQTKAVLLACAFLLGYATVAGCILAPPGRLGLLSTISLLFNSPDYILFTGWSFVAWPEGIYRNWPVFFQTGTAIRRSVEIGEIALGSVLVLALAVRVAGAYATRARQDQPPSRLRLWWERVFCTPMVWQALLKRWLNRSLQRNPVGWLQRRTWTGRLVTWSWFAVVISLDSAFVRFPGSFRGVSEMQQTISWLMAGSMALSAVGSFRRERESRVLELLLVSPMAESEIIFGRLRGLWFQFLPAVGALIGVWLYLGLPTYNTAYGGFDGGPILLCATTLATLPVIGLYYSLRFKGVIPAFLSTMVAGVLLPWLSFYLMAAFLWSYSAPLLTVFDLPVAPHVAVSVVQLVLGFLYWRRLYHRLKHRAFPMMRE